MYKVGGSPERGVDRGGIHRKKMAVLGGSNWTIKEKDADGERTVRDLVAEFMSKVKLWS